MRHVHTSRVSRKSLLFAALLAHRTYPRRPRSHT